MNTFTLRQWVKLALILIASCYAGQTFAQNEAIVNEREIQNFIERNDVASLRILAEKLECIWTDHRDVRYFREMSALIRKLSVSQDEKMCDLMIHCSSRLLQKDNSGEEQPYILYDRQQHVAATLRSNFYRIKQDNNFKRIRDRSLRCIMLFTKRVKSDVIENYQPRKTSMNVAPPIVNDSEQTLYSGMDPKSIRDPATRAAYEAVIREYASNTNMNYVQACLSDRMEDEWPKFEAAIIMIYSKDLNYEELSEYLILGSFNLQERRRIFDGIAIITGVQPPNGLIPTVEELEKEKLKKAEEKIESQKNATPKVEGETKP